jgi:hypothetical protein
METFAIRAAAALVLFAAAPAFAATDGPPLKFFADLSPEEESATVESAGKGRVAFTLERETLRFSWQATFSNLTSPVTLSAVHGPQRPGTNAPPQFNLAPAGTTSPITGSVVLTEAQLQYLLSDRMYVNIHSVKYPDGELRGQIHKVPQPVTN